MVADTGLERNSGPGVTDQSGQMARRSIRAVIRRGALAVVCSGTSFKGTGCWRRKQDKGLGAGNRGKEGTASGLGSAVPGASEGVAPGKAAGRQGPRGTAGASRVMLASLSSP